MDDFLVGLYEEEKTKIAAADLGTFMGTLPVDELEEFLGLAKVAVAGPAEAPYPDSEKGQLAKDQKKADGEVAKIQDLTPPKRKEAMINRVQKIASLRKEAVSGPAAGKNALEKAKIAMRAMRVTRGASDHIKTAAAKYAGQSIAKVAAKKLLDDPRYIDAIASNVIDKGGRHHPKGHKLRKLRESNKGVAAMLGAGGALIGGGLGNAFGRAYGGKKGALIGSGLGALGLGTLGVASSGRVADTNRRLYKSMDKQAR